MKKKLTFRIFLPLLILLLSGFGKEVFANIDGNFKIFAMDTVFNANNFQVLQQNTSGFSILKKEIPASNKTNIKLRVIDNEVDEDEIHVTDNRLSSNNYFATFYNTRSFSDYLVDFKKVSSFQTVFYYLTTYKKYVLFQVFRI
ncbi:hypothetical protein [Flavobacterium algicola]|uniref:hypothetical protein n=1 Tax=Flavobacterium algicola TaxID=556529 RepID=UPI001EFEDD49|nr:hypothetical protein [Flavobacterium algicola]MCG9792537.1 hypothetical protein [Flavobacterium algicola]